MEIRVGDRVRRKRMEPRGHVRVWKYDELTTNVELLFHKPNQIQDTWGMIAAQCIGMGDRNYRIAGMYVEFENVADPEDPVTIPSYETDEGLEYYNDLAFSGTRDYLRVPLIQNPMLAIETGYEDIFVEGESGNKLTFFSITQGTVGVHGRTFSDAVNSKVCGAALVAIPTFGDRTQDVIFSRTYWDLEDQVLKEVSHQIGVTWDIAFVRDEA